MQIVIGADHGGFPLKEMLKKYLADKKFAVKDFGTYSTEAVDYPDIAFLVARSVSTGEYPRGIMIDGTGIASAVVANKLKGVRATPCSDVFMANSAREHNNSNILCLGANIVGTGKAKMILDTWLTTEYPGGRHQKRLDKIANIEAQYVLDLSCGR